MNVYRINSRVAWQGIRGARYTVFSAEILAFEDEQPAGFDSKPDLKQVPQLHEGERLLVGNEPLPPPDQQGMAMMQDKYKHIAEDATVTVDITAAEMAAILAAYDYGIKSIDEPAYKDLNSVIDKLKRQLWV